MKRARAEGALAAALALVLVLVAGAVSQGSGEADRRTSTYVDGRRGLRALHLLLEAAGGHPGRLHAPLAADAPADRTVVIAGPSWPLTKDEIAAALDWTAAGGRLVVVDSVSEGGASVEPLLAAAGLVTETSDDAGGAEPAVENANWSEGLGKIAWRPRRFFSDLPDDAMDERAGERTDHVTARFKATVPVVASVAFGEGELLAVSDVSWLTNLRLREGDDAVLAVRMLLGRPWDDGHVVFDEFHHGFAETGERAGLVRRLLRQTTETWTGRALLVLVAAALVYAAGAAVRFGAPLPEPAPPRRALREHADALGRLFQQSRATGESLRLLADGVRRTCAPRIGLPPHTPPDELANRLRGSVAPGAAELADAYVSAVQSSGQHLAHAEFAQIAERLSSARKRFLHG